MTSGDCAAGERGIAACLLSSPPAGSPVGLSLPPFSPRPRMAQTPSDRAGSQAASCCLSGGRNRKFLDNRRASAMIPGSRGSGGREQGPAVAEPTGSRTFISFPEVTGNPTLVPPPARHRPIALSVFIGLGKTGRDWRTTTQAGPPTVSKAQNSRAVHACVPAVRARRTASGAPLSFKREVAATGEGSP
jgi:hypothetical protein